MTYDDFEKEVREIADYLGCNAGELVSEMNNLAGKMGYIFSPPVELNATKEENENE